MSFINKGNLQVRKKTYSARQIKKFCKKIGDTYYEDDKIRIIFTDILLKQYTIEVNNEVVFFSTNLATFFQHVKIFRQGNWCSYLERLAMDADNKRKETNFEPIDDVIHFGLPTLPEVSSPFLKKE